MGIWNMQIDPYVAPGMGIYTGRTVYNKFGRAINIDTAVFVDVWNGPTNDYIFTDGIIGQAGVSYFISSSNINDRQKISCTGIDEKGFEQRRDQIINGQNKLTLGDNLYWFRLWDAINIDSENILGDIYIYEDTSVTNGIPDDFTKIRGFIRNGDNRTQMSTWTMPINEHGVLCDMILGISNKVQATVAFEIYARLVGTVFILRGAVSINSVGTGLFQRHYYAGTRFSPGADIIVKASTKTNALDVIADFDIKRRLIA